MCAHLKLLLLSTAQHSLEWVLLQTQKLPYALCPFLCHVSFLSLHLKLPELYWLKTGSMDSLTVLWVRSPDWLSQVLHLESQGLHFLLETLDKDPRPSLWRGWQDSVPCGFKTETLSHLYLLSDFFLFCYISLTSTSRKFFAIKVSYDQVIEVNPGQLPYFKSIILVTYTKIPLQCNEIYLQVPGTGTWTSGGSSSNNSQLDLCGWLCLLSQTPEILSQTHHKCEIFSNFSDNCFFSHSQ